MKFPRFLLICFIFSFTYCEDRRKLFAENIKKYVSSLNKIQNSKELIESFQNSKTILCYTLTLKELDEVKLKFDLSQNIIQQIKVAPYVRENSVKKIEEVKEMFNNFGMEETIGAAIKENDEKISFALIKSKSLVNLKTRYEKYYKRECHTVWLVFKRCENVEAEKIKDLTPDEIILIKEAAKYSATSSLLKGAEILSRDDYELNYIRVIHHQYIHQIKKV